MRGWYCWDWYNTRTITFQDDDDLPLSNNEYAASQGCFRKFDDCRKYGLEDLKSQIVDLHDSMVALKMLEIKDVKK